MAEEQYSLKEVIEKNFSDLKADMKQGFYDIKVDAKEIRKTAESADKKAEAANKRLDTYDYHIKLIWGAIVVGFVKIIIDYFGAIGRWMT